MQVDLFGETTGFQIEGSQQYPSAFGTVLSLCIFALVLIYGSNKTSIFLEKSDNTFQEIVKRNELNSTREYSFEEINLYPGLYLIDSRNSQIVSEDDMLGYFTLSANLIKYTTSEGIGWTEAPMSVCTHEYLDTLQVDYDERLFFEYLIQERSFFCI